MSLYRTATLTSILSGLLLMFLSMFLWAGDHDTIFDQANMIKYKSYVSGSSRKSYYLDNCYRLGQDCGTKTAADAWCREYMGFQGGAVSIGGVTAFPAGEKTFTIGDNQECDKDCKIYQSVTCTTANPTRFDAPKFAGFRLDSTENETGGKTDGAVADLYCKSMKFDGVFEQYPIGDAKEATKHIDLPRE